MIEIADNDEAPVEEPPVEEPPADENTVAPGMDFHYWPAGFGTIVGRSIRVPPLNYVYRAPAKGQLVALTDYIVSVEFFVSVDFLATASSSLGVVTQSVPGNRPVGNSFTLIWPNVPAGTYTLTAKGTATDGREIFGGPLTLIVQP